MTPTSKMKRALVSLILHFARIYGVTLSVNRDSPDQDVRTSYRKVLLKAHPDKPGGSEAATKRLTLAHKNWQDAANHRGKAGRPCNPEPQSQSHAMSSADPSPGAKKRNDYRIQSQAVMLTYQGFPDLASWLPFVSFFEASPKSWKVKYWSATLETNKKEGTLHAHVMLQFHTEVDCTVARFAFDGLRPNASMTDLCGFGLCRKKLQQSIDRGMFYVWADKCGTQRLPDGTACIAGNYVPVWAEGKIRYQVLGKWGEDLWKQRKISHATWKAYMYECRDGVVSRKRNFDAVVEHEARQARQKRIAERTARIRGNTTLYSEFPVVPEAVGWLKVFAQDAVRYPVLVVLGKSGTGKTEWAKSLFKNPLVLQIGRLETFPDAMRGYDRDQHDGIILDDLGDLLFLEWHQDKVQGKYDSEVEFASTAGGTCAYYHELFAVPFVATVNYDTKNLGALVTSDFLSLPSNRVLVKWPEVCSN